MGLFIMSRGIPNKRYTAEFKKHVIETMQQEHEEAIAEIEQDAAVYVEENKKIANMTSSEDTIRLQTERDTYKTMYEQLLNRLVNGGAA